MTPAPSDPIAAFVDRADRVVHLTSCARYLHGTTCDCGQATLRDAARAELARLRAAVEAGDRLAEAGELLRDNAAIVGSLRDGELMVLSKRVRALNDALAAYRSARERT